MLGKLVPISGSRALTPAPETRFVRKSRRLFETADIDHHVFFDEVEFVYKGRRTRTVVFDRMSAIVPKGRRVAVMGARRSGKSTLVKLIAGVAVPNAGEVVRNSNISWPIGGNYFISNNLTVRDNVIFCANMLGVSARDMLRYLDDLCGFGSKKEEIVKNIPVHFRQRLNIVLPLVVDFDCFLIEGQVNLKRAKFPPDHIEFIEGEIRRKDLIVVTGNKKMALQYCDTGALIENGHIRYCASVQEAVDQIKDLAPDDTDFSDDQGDEGEFGEQSFGPW